MEAKDLVVVGGGLAGLTLAVLAAKRGLSVTLVERHRDVGGRAVTDRKHGFSLNRGAHALYNGGAARRVLSSLGIEPKGAVPRTDGALALRGDDLHALPGGPISLLWSSVLDLSGKLEVARVLASLRNPKKLDVAALAGVTVNELLGRCTHESARGLLRMLFRVSTYCTDFDHLSAALAVEQLRRATYDQVVYLDGGWQVLVDGLRTRAVDAGVELVQGTARAIDTSGGRATAVVLGDGSIAARNVAIAASPDVAASLTGSPSLQRFAARAAPVRAACLDLGLSSLPRKNPRLVLGIDRPLYMSVHSAYASLAPEGHALVHLVRYLAHDETPNESHVAELEALMERVQPGYRARVMERRVLPNMIVSNARADASFGGVAGRPDVVVPEVSGLYVAGDWVGPEGFLADASFASAAAVADTLRAPVAISV